MKLRSRHSLLREDTLYFFSKQLPGRNPSFERPYSSACKSSWFSFVSSLSETLPTSNTSLMVIPSIFNNLTYSFMVSMTPQYAFYSQSNVLQEEYWTDMRKNLKNKRNSVNEVTIGYWSFIKQIAFISQNLKTKKHLPLTACKTLLYYNIFITKFGKYSTEG